jgi:ParB-like chromosome segregation protein Spo0J
MTAEWLRNLESNYRHVQRRADAARYERNAGIHEALAEGWTHAQIAEVTGLSRGRISQIPPPAE